MSVLSGSRIIVGVTGGIAAYKAADLTSKLVQAGAIVDVIMTEAAEKFVGSATFQALTKRHVHQSVFADWTEDWHGHISLAQDADAIVIVPATANTIGRFAAGLSDDMLGSVLLSTRAPLLIVPAMEHEMYRHPATQANLETLKSRGVIQVGPETGRLASGKLGEGRMSSVEAVIGALRKVLGRGGPLTGMKAVITAGGTREPIDPVRYLGNRSSGLMGFSLAQAAVDAGASVTLISTIQSTAIPFGVDLVRVQTAQEMFEAVMRETESAQILIMAAAVADFRPVQPARDKMKKTPGNDHISLELAKTADIIASVQNLGLLKVGFAAETQNLIEYATAKMHDKGLAMIVANDAELTIGSPDSAAFILFANGKPMIKLPRLPKAEVAEHVMAEISFIAQPTSHV